ncbi:MAG TPA: cupin domain-containing protein [Solirubrobacteraceae bacterium]|jgi:quercetin dioxygenase-like cupin family protein
MSEVRGSFETLPVDEPYPGVTRRTFSSGNATFMNYRFVPGARFPRHTHPQEQVTLVQSGTIEMSLGDRLESLSAGEYSIAAPDVEHGITAGEGGASIVAIVVPRREGSNAYTVVDNS